MQMRTCCFLLWAFLIGPVATQAQGEVPFDLYLEPMSI